jgi:hypothetical protein
VTEARTLRVVRRDVGIAHLMIVGVRLRLLVDYRIVFFFLCVGAYLGLTRRLQHLPRWIQVDQADITGANTACIVARCLRGRRGRCLVYERLQSGMRRISTGIIRCNDVLDLRLQHVVFTLEFLQHPLDTI